MNQVDPPVTTDAEKLAYFNANYPIYDNQQIEIAGIVERSLTKHRLHSTALATGLVLLKRGKSKRTCSDLSV